MERVDRDSTRLDSTREILVDERRGAGAVRLDVWGSLAGCFSKIRARRGERGKLWNERERGWRTVGKKAREGKETNYARIVVFRGCIGVGGGAIFAAFRASLATGFSFILSASTLTRHFPFCREESFVSHRPPVKDSTK